MILKPLWGACEGESSRGGLAEISRMGESECEADDEPWLCFHFYLLSMTNFLRAIMRFRYSERMKSFISLSTRFSSINLSSTISHLNSYFKLIVPSLLNSIFLIFWSNFWYTSMTSLQYFLNFSWFISSLRHFFSSSCSLVLFYSFWTVCCFCSRCSRASACLSTVILVLLDVVTFSLISSSS